MKARKDVFAPLCQLQLQSHCGPCSLSACLFILGIQATQRQLAKAAGRPVSVFVHGVDEQGLRKAARKYGVKSEFMLYSDREAGREFARNLRNHLKKGNPAILLSRDFDHWIAAIGYLSKQRRFIIIDPKVENSVFLRWSERHLLKQAWNRNSSDVLTGEPDQYFGIFLSRLDNKPAKWRITESWLRLCERGSADTAQGMANDLAEIAALASPDEHSIEDGPYIAEELEEFENVIVESITHWAQGAGHANKTDLRTLYRDYTTIASSSGIRIAPDADIAAMIAQFTALLCSYWWGARF